MRNQKQGLILDISALALTPPTVYIPLLSPLSDNTVSHHPLRPLKNMEEPQIHLPFQGSQHLHGQTLKTMQNA
jgi:hypothetical protein